MSLVVLHRVDSWLAQTETWLYQQVRHLPPEIQSHIACYSTTNLDQFGLPNIHELPKASETQKLLTRIADRLGTQLTPRKLCRLARQIDARVLHSHFGHVGWRDLPVARKAGLRQIVTFYGYDVGSVPNWHAHWRKRYLDMFQNVSQVLCEGPHMAGLIRQLGCPAEKVRVHHLGVRVGDIQFRPRSWERTQPLRVLIAASFREKKGIPYAMEALGILSGNTSLEITVIGDASSDPSSQQQKALIMQNVEKYQMQPFTRFLGYVSHARLFEEAYNHHVFLSPSVTAGDGDIEGGAPVSIIDMMSTGLLIVSSRHCDIPNVILDGKTGLLADERDVNGLVQHLTWLAENADRWDEISRAARRRAEEEFDAQVQGQRLAAIYQGVANN
jgi:colanic acid/amylovoran biosynthesis glycosyltransferase